MFTEVFEAVRTVLTRGSRARRVGARVACEALVPVLRRVDHPDVQIIATAIESACTVSGRGRN